MSSKLIAIFTELRSDKLRWEWLIANKDKGLKLVLDNDDTMIVDTNIDPDEVDEDFVYHASFDYYIGYSVGVFNMLHAMGIDAEFC